MGYATELLKGLYEATKSHKVNWVESSTNGAYFAKVGERKVEIVFPATDFRSQLQDQAERQANIIMSNMDPNIRQKIPITQWRIIVYSDDGKVSLEVGENNVIREKEGDREKILEMFKYIYNYASDRSDDKSRSVVNDILKQLK